MKKQIIFTALALGAIVFGTNNLQAQVTATTTVNINLADVISIDAGSVATGGLVAFNYTTALHYNSDQTVKVPTSLIVTSTTAFDINVKAVGANFAKGTDLIPVDVLTIKPITGGSTTMGGVKTQRILTIGDQKIVTAAPFGSAKVLEIDYHIPAAKSIIDILGKPAGTYTQNVTYTATAI